MDFVTLQSNVVDWVAGLATDRTGAAIPVQWGPAPHKVYTTPYILVYPGTIVQLGQDVRRYETNDTTGELEETMHGVRRGTFRLSFRNFDQRLGYSAWYYAERFRVRTQGTFGKESLPDPMGFVSTGSLIQIDPPWSGRALSRVEMDLVLNWWMTLVDDDYSGGWLQTVNMEMQHYLLDQWGNPIEDLLGNPVIDLDIRNFTVSSLLKP